MERPPWLWLGEKSRNISRRSNDAQKGKSSATPQVAFILFSKTQVCLDLLNDNPPSLLYPQDKNPQSRDNADDLQGRAA